jgi:Tfp pilus assembly protein PilO
MPSLKTQIAWFTRVQQALIGAVLVTAVIFYAAVYRPETGRLGDLSSSIAQRERELNVAQTQTGVLPQVEADIHRLKDELKDFQRLPANPQDLGQFQIEMSELAKYDNLRGLQVRWSGMPKRDESLCQLPISLKFDGNFLDVYSFLCDVEKLSRLTRVQSLTVKCPNADGNVEVDLVMNLYYSEG